MSFILIANWIFSCRICWFSWPCIQCTIPTCIAKLECIAHSNRNHQNAFRMYCVLSFDLIPLLLDIGNVYWKFINSFVEGISSFFSLSSSLSPQSNSSGSSELYAIPFPCIPFQMLFNKATLRWSVDHRNFNSYTRIRPIKKINAWKCRKYFSTVGLYVLCTKVEDRRCAQNRNIAQFYYWNEKINEYKECNKYDTVRRPVSSMFSLFRFLFSISIATHSLTYAVFCTS